MPVCNGERPCMGHSKTGSPVYWALLAHLQDTAEEVVIDSGEIVQCEASVPVQNQRLLFWRL